MHKHLYPHGRAFVVRSFSPLYPVFVPVLVSDGECHLSHPTASLDKGILEHSTSLQLGVLSVDYRLSSGPPLKREDPFPTAVIDSIAAYTYLVCMVGFLPRDIVITGESAGGNIALTLGVFTVAANAASAAAADAD